MTTHHHHHPADLDSTSLPDSTTSTPHSDHHHHLTADLETHHPPRVRFMCSFGGKILPRPHDNQLRYVGGDTRIVAVHRHTTTYSSLLNKLSKISNTRNLTLKYQLPNEDLDALITVTTDEDVENMIDEYDRFHQNNSQSQSKASPWLRLFLFSNDSVSRTSSISSLLDGSTKREHWFLDALNGGSALECGRSEVSSIMSEMPDYLFGLDNSEDQTHDLKPKIRPENVVIDSDPGSPYPAGSTPFCSASSSLAPPGRPPTPELPPVKTKPDKSTRPENVVLDSDPGSPHPAGSTLFCSASSSLAPPGRPPTPELPPVKTKPDKSIPVTDPKEGPVETFMQASDPPIGYLGNPTWHYGSDPHYPTQGLKQMPIYYVPSSAPSANVPISSVPIQAQYVQSYPAPSGQIPIGYHHNIPGMGQVYGGGAGPIAAVNPYAMASRVVPEGMNQAIYYGRRNGYPGMVVSGGEELQVNGPEGKESRVFRS
ncbi:hypothetical protein Vadar_012867 [Vaccinium darrowii]|uniref:Uncharacterized protein n=1 Tax=Vaccinium darrowii TaxID=229202 RepID=A0ACB7X9W5_9ERIC|nr:hypothetical protein Vadar_012867 [Vaccinium darrowii]